MEHPFLGDLSDKSIDDLTEIINKLNKALAGQLRMNRRDMAGQISMVLENYRSELADRNRKLLEKEPAITGSIDIS